MGRGSGFNDDLTFRHSRPDDIWLHARDSAGAHVILRWERARRTSGSRSSRSRGVGSAELQVKNVGKCTGGLDAPEVRPKAQKVPSGERRPRSGKDPLRRTRCDPLGPPQRVESALDRGAGAEVFT